MKKAMKIYFAGAIRGGREDAALYQEIITHLKQYGKVLTEHIGDTRLGSLGENDRKEEMVHDRDMEWIEQSDIIVAEVSTPSLGVGYEIGRAVEHGKKILCMYRDQPGKMLSAMIAGSPGVTNAGYRTMDDARKIMDEFFSLL
jgi:nucleoside 2-deoxyribosyltransferase